MWMAGRRTPALCCMLMPIPNLLLKLLFAVLLANAVRLRCARCRFGALSGVAATLTFAALQRSVGLVGTGASAIWLQLACLLCATAPAVAGLLIGTAGGRGGLYALVWGLVVSRFGLWTFDLSVNQLIQEEVEHSVLGEPARVGTQWLPCPPRQTACRCTSVSSICYGVAE